MAATPSFDDLIDKHAKAKAKVARLQASLDVATRDFDELDVAVKVLVKHGYISTSNAENDAPEKEQELSSLNENQIRVWECVPDGAAYAIAPKDVASMLNRSGRDDISADYVRTTLWRLAKRGVIESNNGLYWRVSAQEAFGKTEAPGAQTPEASEVSGLADGSQGRATHLDPEGSIPSSSTPPRFDPNWDDLDADVPF